ncbi:allophanate hydrolase [Leptothrix discophora]|uniref:Allophanate hydrolase n=1 Tax=Leptothrix discophora TaxID=89 RepID=A0ABT9G841_LEPDI|nr:allophanate hydrolase [Leptothrix discophora]MDP4302641.1 allophanate hydrolase [Leptothrix discophora]
MRDTDPTTPTLPPRTLAGWRAIQDRPDHLHAALAATLDRVHASAAAGIWISLCPRAAWVAQLDTLAERLAAVADPAERHRRWPLLGVPFGIKDNIDVAGVPTTAACPAFRRLPTEHASAVQKLLDAGAIWVGKTNLDQFATGLVGTRSPYGRPASVVDPTRISGGSSSGSAAAVARGQVPFALATDTAGSGRVPAGFNGLVGLKPTPGRVGNGGVLPACRTLDCVAVLAHTVGDAAEVLACIEGPDPRDAYSAFRPGPAQLPVTLRVGVPHLPDLDDALGYTGAWAAAQAHLAALGHRRVEVDMAPLAAVAALLYDGPWVAERHAVVRELLATQPGAFDPTVRRVIERALPLRATDAFDGLYRLQERQAAAADLWQQVDLLMLPTAPTHPTFAEVDADPVGVNSRLGAYTNFVNLLGWCALALPAGSTGAGLPFGVTFVAPGRHDAALARFGLAWCGEAEPSAGAWPAALSPPHPADAIAARIGLPLAEAHRPGVRRYFDLAAGMADRVMGLPLGLDDEPAGSFVPIGPDEQVAGEHR